MIGAIWAEEGWGRRAHSTQLKRCHIGDRTPALGFARVSRRLPVPAQQMVRWITDVEGISNFRDLQTGDFPADLVFRSADLSELTKSGLVSLSKYVTTIIDVRSLPEIRRNGTIGKGPEYFTDQDLDQHGMKRLHCPVFLESDYSPAAIASRHKLYSAGEEGFIAAYRGILNNLTPTLKTVFHELSQIIGRSEPRGILIHCSAGKDRTGILCALLLVLAHVSPQDVALEYALTTQGLALHHERIIASLGSLISKQDKDTAKIMMSSEAPVMERTLQIIEAEYGGVEKFCRDRVDPDDYHVVLQKLHPAYLESNKL